MKTYLINIKKQFAYYKMLGEKTFYQLSDNEINWKLNSNSNSIAMIVNHLSGNMFSRWTDLLTSDSEKPWRNRDQEFEDVKWTKDELNEKWVQAWQCLFDALNQLKDEDLDKIIYIRNQGHTVMEAINRQLAHYPYHIGQIVYIGKMIKNEEWNSLSIPKNQSDNYNAEKFEQEKKDQHFTDEYL